MVNVELPVPGAAMAAVLRVSVTPVGWPLAVKAIAESKPPETVVVIVEVPLLLCTTETDAGEAEIANAGDALVGASALISPTPFGLPQPVTRS
jgi:hypothetical protein